MHNTPSRPVRWSGLSCKLSIAAVVFFVALLAGSMIFVFHMTPQNGNGTTVAGNNTRISLDPTPDFRPVPGIYISSEKDLGGNNCQINGLAKNSHQVIWSYTVGQLTSSIVVEGNTVYVSASEVPNQQNNYAYVLNTLSGGPNPLENYVYALNATSGALRWRSMVSYTDTSSLNTPAVSGDVVYVISKDGTVYALSGADGKTLWSYNTQMLYNPGNVTVANGIVYATMRTGLFAINTKSGKLVWSQQTDNTQILNSPQVVDGAVYLSSSSVSQHYAGQTQTGAIYSFDAKSGKQNWKHAVDNWVLSSPTVVNGVVYAGSYDTNLYALKASDGSALWHYTTGGYIFDSPLVSNGVVYVTEHGNAKEISDQPPTVEPALFAIDATKGTKLWSQPLDISLQAIQNGVIYGCVFPRAVYALKVSDGSVIWHQQYGPNLIDKTGADNGAAPQITVIP